MKRKFLHLPLLLVLLLISIIARAHHPALLEHDKLDLNPDNKQIVVTSTNTSCGEANGTATVETFGIPVAQIAWSNGVSGGSAYTITGLPNGKYSVTVTAPPLVAVADVVVGYSDENIVEASSNMGFSDDDFASDMAETNTGGFIAVGSINGAAATYGAEDAWVTVRNHNLSTVWSKVYGGSADDVIVKVLALSDGYMIAGHTRSNDGTVPTYVLGLWDMWLTKIDFTGNIVWSLKYGGNSTEFLFDIIQTCDNGFLFVGASASTNLGVKGGYDYYACKITSSGAINWRTLVGGSFDDYATSAVELPNGNFVLSGYSESNDGDVSGNYSLGSWDIWLAEINSAGVFTGGRNYGGTGNDRPYDMIANQDNSVYLIAASNSNNGEAGSTVFGGNDYLLMHIQPPSTGNFVYSSNKFGGSGSDIPASLVRTGDGGLLVGGTTSSNNGTIQSGNTGGTEYWLTKFTTSTNPTLEWEKTYGSNPGGFNDDCAGAIQVADGGYAMIGSTQGNLNFGLSDYWVIVLDQSLPLSVQFNVVNTCAAVANGSITATVSGGLPPITYNWSNGASTATNTGLIPGNYTLTATDAAGCTIVQAATVVAGSPPSISFSQTTPSCPSSTGVISSFVQGGTVPYTYNWSTGATTADAVGLEPGVVYLTVTDAAGCIATANAIVQTPPGQINAYIRVSESECSFNSGAGQALVKNPVGGYSYQWSNGQTGINVNSLPPGEVYVDIGSSSTPTCKARRYRGIVQDSKPPQIEWVQNYGGSNDDAGWDIKETTDGNFILAGQSRSNNGDVGGNNGDQDVWILKINPAGGIIWEENYGGSAADLARSIIEADSSEYTFAGTSSSSDFDVAKNYGLSDVWVGNINNTGGLNWEKNYGGSDGDDGLVVRSQNNKELVVGAWSSSSNFDVPSGNGGAEYWLFTANQFSDRIISKSNGGSSQDYLLDAITTSDGGYMTIGYTFSSNFDVSANNGGIDVWVVKYNRFGNLSWEENYGGTNNDFGYQIIELKDCSGYVFVGYTGSSNVDVSSNYGMDDVWVVKINNSGGVIWEENFGGTQVDQGLTLQETGDGGYLIGGHTTSSDNDVSTNLGGEDFWLFKIDENGILQWEETYGGSDDERLLGMNLTKDGGYILTGFTRSNDIDVPGNNGLQDILTIKLAPPVNPNVTGVSTDAICVGSATGSINITVTNGELPYSFIWSNGATTEDLTGLVAGNYIVTVTEANGCSSGIGLQVGNQKNVTITTTVNNPGCINDGFINVVLQGAIPPIVYNWSNGASTQNISNLTAGTYTITATDRDGCTATASETLTGALKLIVSVSSSNVSCFGGTNGSAFASGTGGLLPYTYQWSTNSGSQTTSTATGLSIGTYLVTVTDANSCTATDQVTITQEAEIVTTIGVNQPAPCINPGGSATALVNGGVSPYTILWPNGGTGPTNTQLLAGWNTVTVTDFNGCQDTTGFSMPTQSPPVINSITATDATCGQNNGTATVSGAGTPPITYLWSNGGTLPSIGNIGPGSYTVTVTDLSNCSATAQVSVSNIGGPTATIDQTNQPVCGDNGSILITASGGATPYSYNWSNGATTEDVSGLSGGAYTVSVTDDNNCTTIVSTSLNNSPALFLNRLQSNVVCNGESSGNIFVTVQGGTAPYVYIWSNGASTKDLNNVPAGTYSQTVTDVNGCSDTFSTIVTEPLPIGLTLTELQTPTCGNSDGVVEALISNGVFPYQYIWNTGETTAVITGIPAGTYAVTATDANGCMDSDFLFLFDIGGPAVNIVNVVQPACADNGSITINVSSGTTPYSYNWSNGATTEDISGLAGGSYILTVTDFNNCTSILTETLMSSPALSTSFTSTNISCNGASSGSILASNVGGTSPYTYVWSNGAPNTNAQLNLPAGNYSFTITDVNGCTASNFVTLTEPPAITLTLNELKSSTCGNSDGEADALAVGGTPGFQYLWSTGDTGTFVSGLASGTYTLTATDSNGCTTTGSVNIADLGGPAIAQTATIDPSCDDDGEISITVTGGVTPYSYNWSNGGNTSTITGLAPGSYIVTITDASGCNTIASNTLIAPLFPNATIDQQTNIICFGLSTGAADITVTGGVAPYFYEWSSNGQTTEDVTGLPAGTNTVTFTDMNNCKGTLIVVITSPSELLAVATPGNPSTCGASNGDVSVTASGSNPPYTYLWSNGATTTTISGLFSGSYFVTVSDVNGCTGTDVAIVSDIGAPTGSIINGVNPSCNDDGSMTISVTGGSTPYIYNWSNGASTATITGLSAGTYFVTVLDDSGCILITSEQLNPAPLPVLTLINSQAVSCNGISDGYINVQVSSGTVPYSYTWSNGASSQNISNLPQGTYTVTVTDGASCVATLSQVISEPPLLSAVASLDNNASCGNSDGQASASATGGISPYQYIWSNGSATQVISGLLGGNYTVTVTDANLCQTASTVTVGNTSPPTISGFVNNNPDCGATNGTVTVLASGSQTPLTYSSDLGVTYQSSNFFTGLGPGFYTFIVKDNLGCTDSDTTTLFSGGAPVINTVNTVQPICQDSSGSIEMITTPSTGIDYSINGGVTTQTSPLFLGLPSGTYYLVAEDQNGCQGFDTITLTDIAGPMIASVSIIEPNCGQADGSITITASGGTGALDYSIDGGLTYLPTSGFSTLPAATYNIVVQDANGCKAFDVALLTDQSGVVLDSVSVIDSSCDFVSGSIVIHASGINVPFQYSIDNGGNFQLSNTFPNLAPGQYDVVVVDTNNCQATSVVEIQYNTPPSFVLLQGITDTYCGKSIGEISIAANGGTPPLEFALNGNPYQSSNTFTNLSAGFYTLMVRDSNGCEITRIEEIEDLPGPTVSVASSSLPTCGQSNGSVTFTSIQGLAPYQYSFENGPFTSNPTVSNLFMGSYTVIVSDVNDCRDTLQFTLNDIPPPTIDLINKIDPTCGNSNGSITISVSGASPPFTYAITGFPPQGSNVFTSLSPNTYVVTVSDVNGCTTTDQITLNDQGGATITSYNAVQPICGNSNGSITVQTTGGTTPLLFNINNGALQVSNVFSNLVEATYTFTVQDANGCITTGSYLLQDIPGPTIDTVIVVDPACNQVNGSITINASSGTPPFDYSIDNGASYLLNNQISNLPAGTLLIVVRDANGCTANTSVVLQDIPGPTITSIQTTDPDCGATNGEATVQLTAGTAPFSYVWSTVPSQTGATAVGLTVGTYTVTVTDSYNCTTTGTTVINVPVVPFVDLGPDEISCVPPNTFSDAMNVGADYSWSTGDTTQTIDVLNYGVYAVTVTAVNGCTGTDEIAFIDSQYNPQIMNDTILFLGNTAQLQASGGDNYEWWPSGDLSCSFCPDPEATPSITTVYSVEISTVDGCADTLQVEIRVDEEVIVPDVISPNDDGMNDNWIIPHIENFPFNRLTIVNRWGDVVFSANPYTNNWGGTLNGKPLPQGTYYYLLETDVNINNPKKGTITILK